MRIKLLYVVAMSLCITLAAASPALAHTEVVGTDPEDGASLGRAPDRVSLTLDGPVEAEFSPLEVYDERDERVDLDDARLASDGSTLLASLKEGLGGGEYTVEYRYTGVDGHPIEGSYGFSVSGEPAPASSEASGDSEDAGGERQADRTGGVPPVVYGVLGLGAVAVVGAVVLRRR